MFASRSVGQSVDTADTQQQQQQQAQCDNNNLDEKEGSKKRGRCLSRLFQVNKRNVTSSGGSGGSATSISGGATTSSSDSTSKFNVSLRKHVKNKMSGTPSSSSSNGGGGGSGGSGTEPQQKRVLRDVVAFDPATAQSTTALATGGNDMIFVQTANAAVLENVDDWKRELDRLAWQTGRQLHQQTGSLNPEWTWKEAVSLAVSLVRPWVRHGGSPASVVAGPNFAEWNKNDHLSCPKCGGVLHQVATLSCGHSYCRKCANTLDQCSKCCRAAVVHPDQLRTNVTVSMLVEKWWADELKAVELRNLGNKDFAEQLYDLALDKYHRALQSGEYQTFSISNVLPFFFSFFSLRHIIWSCYVTPDIVAGYVTRLPGLLILYGISCVLVEWRTGFGVT